MSTSQPPGARASRTSGLRATAASYDATAERYLAVVGDELAGKPVDRALLTCFLELCRPVTHPGTGGSSGDCEPVDARVTPADPGTAASQPGRLIADVGCGPGHVAGHLAELGASMIGVDLSRRMSQVGARRYPAVPFVVGSMCELPFADGALGGLLSLYAIIHLRRRDRQRAYAEFARVLAPGGWLLLGFHVSDHDHAVRTAMLLDEWWGHRVELEFHYLDPDQVGADLRAAGLRPMMQLVREPWEGVEHASRRGYLLARHA